jgi:hypothetical protein
MKNREKKSDTRDIETHRTTWHGIELEIGFERNWLGSPPSDYHPSHLEIRSVNPPKEPLPVTETGYLSHFLEPADIDNAGGPVAFVVNALDKAAKSKEWKAHDAARRQLSLF